MIILRTPQEMKNWRTQIVDKSVGFVPTMGALHQGHESLIQKSKSENDLTILSIFVNPTQFNNASDLTHYPKTWESDLQMAEKNKVDVLFFPNAESMYPDQYQFKMTETNFSQKLCGAHRPGHFDGVLSVVLKLFMLTHPHKAYFGEKDFQQLTLIQKMVEAYFLNIAIVPVPTLREESGLAMSSRNLRLSPEQREKAALIFKFLKSSQTLEEVSEQLTQNGFQVDYVEEHFGRRFVAAFLGEVRLIDNVQI